MRTRVGLIGAGYIGKIHALAWNQVASVFERIDRPNLFMLAEADDALAKQKAKAFGFTHATTDWKQVVDECDVISICTPNEHHFEMAKYAIEKGKDIWLEKPMTSSIEKTKTLYDLMMKQGNSSGAVGYNYIQNPIIRQIYKLIKDGEIGRLFQVRVEMDEDFMADKDSTFSNRNSIVSGFGAIDDFGVHALSLLHPLNLPFTEVLCDMQKPYSHKRDSSGQLTLVSNFDMCNIFLKGDDINATVMLNRSAWGRKGRIALQFYGTEGSIIYDQEKLNEFEIYRADGRKDELGYKKVLTSSEHKPYGMFIPAPGHSIGFNDLKVIECNEILNYFQGKPAHLIDFKAGLDIEKIVGKAIDSFTERNWKTL